MSLFSFIISFLKSKHNHVNNTNNNNTNNKEFKLIIDPKEFCLTSFSLINIPYIFKSFQQKTSLPIDFHPFIYHLSSIFPVYFLYSDSINKNKLDPLNLCKTLFLNEFPNKNYLFITNNSKNIKEINKRFTLQIKKNDNLFDILSFLLYNRYIIINNQLNKISKENISINLKKIYFERNFFNFNWHNKYEIEINKINNERRIEYNNILNYIKQQNNSSIRIINNVFKKYYEVLNNFYQNI